VAYVSVGMPTAIAFAEADRMLRRNLTVLTVVAVLAIAAAWFGAKLLILRPVNALVAATRRLSAGDLGARTGLPHDPGELNQLARAFDEMAGSLEQAEERRRLEEELRRKNFELEQQNRSIQEANRLKSEFVSMVSHELRTPLTSIQGYLALVLQGESGELTAEQREFLTVVQNNTDRLLALINDLLDLARMEAGRIELHCVALDLARLIQDAARALRPLIEAKQQQLTLDLPPALPPVWADATRVAQVVTNLISNAHKYTPAGGTIRVAARAADSSVRVEVRDTGIGLSEEEQAQCFTKFFRAKDRRAQEAGGTGLGLAISRSLVELHGGEITVSSAPGQGSTFAVTLPVCQSTPVQENKDTAALVGQVRPGARILVVDDEPDVVNLIRRYLERAGCEVLVARDGAETLRVARAERPELIILDIILPDVDGFAVLEWLKADPLTGMIPVLLLSVVDDARRGKLLGAVDYLVKPVSESVLLERVGRILAADPARLILVADDDADVRALLARHLRHVGYQVVEAADGAQVVALAQRDRLDLALIDVKMPGMDGIAALRALRADSTTRELPVIMITASPAAAGESLSVIDALGGELLFKPVSAEELTEAIRRGLAGVKHG
jgi:signal transduction histidine kinase/CheY-like chemotaxis protein